MDYLTRVHRRLVYITVGRDLDRLIWSYSFGDEYAKALLREDNFSLATNPVAVCAIQKCDFEAAFYSHANTYALSCAAQAGNLGLITRLLMYGADPNDGPSFMKRPLQTAITHGQLETAKFFLQQRATADLGDLLKPLCHAVFQGNLAQARSILQQPRKLVAEIPKLSATSKYGPLRKNFRLEHDIVLEKSYVSKYQPFRAIGAFFQDYRTMWKEGMSALRRLHKKRRPKDFNQVLSLLVIASAMRKTSISKDEFGSEDLFLDDLDRWRCLAIDEHEQALFDEIARVVWGKTTVIDNLRNAQDFEQELEHLNRLMQELMSDIGGSSPVPLWDMSFLDFPPSRETHVTLRTKRANHQDPANTSSQRVPSEAVDSPPETRRMPLKAPLPFATHGEWTPASKVALILMIGAIFAVVVNFFLSIHIK